MAGRWPGMTLVLIGVSACSLLTPLEGFSTGDAPSSDPSPTDDASLSPRDGGTSDVAPRQDGAVEGDAGRAAAYRAAVMADDPLAYYRFEETSGTATIDETGVRNGLWHGAPLFDQPGIVPGSRAVRLPSGIASYAEIADPAVRLVDTLFTLEAWAKPGKLADYRFLASTEQRGFPRSGFSLVVDAVAVVYWEVWFTEGNTHSAARSFQLPDHPLSGTGFHHIVISFDGSQDHAYVNGERVLSNDTARTIQDAGPLRLGCRFHDGVANGCLEDWVLDEVAIYGKALTAERVRAHYDLGRP